MSEFSSYENLTDYQRRCLPASNYWRVMNMQEPIPVPLSDTDYHNTFDNRCYDRVEEYQEMKNRQL